MYWFLYDVFLFSLQRLLTGYSHPVFVEYVVFHASDRPSESLDAVEKADDDDEENC